MRSRVRSLEQFGEKLQVYRLQAKLLGKFDLVADQTSALHEKQKVLETELHERAKGGFLVSQIDLSGVVLLDSKDHCNGSRQRGLRHTDILQFHARRVQSTVLLVEGLDLG